MVVYAIHKCYTLNMKTHALHFVGFSDSAQYARAVRIWGQPDFIHVHWDVRVVHGGEYDPIHDTIVFAQGNENSKVRAWAWNDSERF